MFDRGSFIVALTFLAITAFQIKQLIDMVDQSNRDIASFLDAVRFDDLTASFKTNSKDPYVQRFHDELNDALTRLRNTRQEKDSEYLFYKNIVMHVALAW